MWPKCRGSSRERFSGAFEVWPRSEISSHSHRHGKCKVWWTGCATNLSWLICLEIWKIVRVTEEVDIRYTRFEHFTLFHSNDPIVPNKLPVSRNLIFARISVLIDTFITCKAVATIRIKIAAQKSKCTIVPNKSLMAVSYSDHSCNSFGVLFLC